MLSDGSLELDWNPRATLMMLLEAHRAGRAGLRTVEMGRA